MPASEPLSAILGQNYNNNFQNIQLLRNCTYLIYDCGGMLLVLLLLAASLLRVVTRQLIASPVSCVLLCCCVSIVAAIWSLFVASKGSGSLVPFFGVSGVPMFWYYTHYVLRAPSCGRQFFCYCHSPYPRNIRVRLCFAVKVGKAIYVCSCNIKRKHLVPV